MSRTGAADRLAQPSSRTAPSRRGSSSPPAPRTSCASCASSSDLARPSSSRSTTSGSRRDEPVEDGATFEANARLKARFYARADRPADARRRLGPRGRRARRRPRRPDPSLRRRGRHRRGEQREAPRALAGLPPERRGARYVCVLALALPGGGRARAAAWPIAAQTRGTCRGRIATGPRGRGGFGYDPIFEPAAEPPGGRTLGQWSAAEKHAISHRARAARRMAPRLAALGF